MANNRLFELKANLQVELHAFFGLLVSAIMWSFQVLLHISLWAFDLPKRTWVLLTSSVAEILHRIAELIHSSPESNEYDHSGDIEKILAEAHGRLPQRFTFASLEAATNGFSASRKLGAGGFGTVYMGKHFEGQQVQQFAVKKLGASNQEGEGLKQFIAEVASMASTSHVNVIHLHGFCIEASHRMLVYEYMPNGSLDHWLFHQAQPLTWQQRLNIALGVARGLGYLHDECAEPILHLDIKPQNILLDDRFLPKVADFGMAKLLVDRDVSMVVTGIRGTPGYIAPEWMLQAGVSKKCDVYSYGMVLLELLSGRKNVDISRLKPDRSTTDIDNEDTWYYPSWAARQVASGNIFKIVDERISSSVNEDELRRVVYIALWCIQEQPHLRPAMRDVVQVLEGLKNVDEPPQSFFFTTTASPSASQWTTDISTSAPDLQSHLTESVSDLLC